tara:strand:+ start:91 stop:621 length:531 start_codon:yes stop_codon:yes gene_type:complete
MPDYNNGLIYKITVADDYIYVGSCCDFDKRKKDHKKRIYNENSEKYNLKLYTAIREIDSQFNIETDMEILHYFPCENDTELRQEEERMRKHLNATLNMRRAYRTEEERRVDNKKWIEENKELHSINKKKWRAENSEKLKEYFRIRAKKRVKCPFCSKEMFIGSLSTHKKTYCYNII